MFFSKTIKQWNEKGAIKKEIALLEKKEKALKETLSTALFGYIMGVVGTSVLSGIFYMMIQANQQILNASGETMSTILTLLIGYSLPIYFLLLLDIMKMLYMTFNSLWIFLKFIFVEAESYDLENEPIFRVLFKHHKWLNKHPC